MSLDRRDWLRLAVGAAACGLGGSIAGPTLRRRAGRMGGVLHPALLRPPGAGDEADFLAACIRCGRCVIACPSDVLHLAGPAAGLANGTPFLLARRRPCNLCEGYEDLRCIAECPTQALAWPRELADRPLPEKIVEIEMGVAVIDPDRCLAWNDQICRSCWHACPFPDSAILLDELGRAVVVPEHCIGCGLCEYACLTEPTSIHVVPEGVEL